MNIHIQLRYALFSLSLIFPLFPAGDIDITPESTRAVLQKFDFYHQEISTQSPNESKPQTAFDALGIHPANKLTGEGTCVALLDYLMERPSEYTPLHIINLMQDPDRDRSAYPLRNNSARIYNDYIHGTNLATFIAGQRPSVQSDYHRQWGLAPNTFIKIFDRDNFIQAGNALLKDNQVFCINIAIDIPIEAYAHYICSTFIPQAYAKNKIVVFSSGNTGDNLAYNRSGIWLEKRIRMAQQYPNVIIASGQVNGTSNPRNPYTNHINNDELYNRPFGYLTVPAQAMIPVHTFSHTDEFLLCCGSSYAAAATSGSLALLKQAFPEMSAVELVKLATLSAIRSPEAESLSMELDQSLSEALWILHNSSSVGITATNLSDVNTRILATTNCLEKLMQCQSTTIDEQIIAPLKLFGQEIKMNFTQIFNSTQALIRWAEDNSSADVETFLHRFFYAILMPVISKIEAVAYTCSTSKNDDLLKQVVTRIRQLNQAHKARNDLNVHRALALGAFAHRDAESWETFQNLSFKKDHAYINELLSNV